MATELELRVMQKRILTMLLEIKADPSLIDRLIRNHCLEMEEEDVALIKQRLGHTE